MTMARWLGDAQDAWFGLRRRPLRAWLSGLGVGIGVMALVAALSISEGAKREALAKIASLGVETIRIENAVKQSQVGKPSLANLSMGLTLQDVDLLRSHLSGKGEFAAFARVDNLSANVGSQQGVLTALGVDLAWPELERLSLGWGRWFTLSDVVEHASVCVLGSRIANMLHVAGPSVAIVGNTPCLVIGVMKPKGLLLTEGTGLASIDFDGLVVFPITAFPHGKHEAGQVLVDGIVARFPGYGESAMLRAADRTEQLLLEWHRRVRDFRLVVPQKLLKEQRETQILFALVMGSIAGLSLLVGGIGVMNVMLANVAEQTREIGLRISLGATRLRIVRLFLWHSVLISLTGTIWGLAAGVGLAVLVQVYAGWAIAFSVVSLMLGPLSAAFAGILFGLYPAMRAAALNPAQALRDT